MMNEDDTPRTDLPLDVPSIHDEEEAVKEDANEEDIAGTGYVPYHPYPGPVPPIPPAHWTDEYQVSFAHCVLEFPTRAVFPAVAKKGKLYVAWDTNKIYRWDGKTYVELTGGGSSPVAALASLTLTQGGRTLGVFNPNGSDSAINIPTPTIPTVPTKLSQLQNDVGYITSVSWEEVSNKPNFATVAITGDYNDLTNKPEIPVLPQFATVATTGQYSDLIGAPTIPVVPEKVSAFENDAGYITADDIPEVPAPGNGTLTIKQGDTTLGTFSANAGQDAEINIPTQAIPDQVNADWDATEGVSQILNKPTLAAVATTGSYSDLVGTPDIPTKTSQLTNDSGFITGVTWDEVTNKPEFASVATSGSAEDLFDVVAPHSQLESKMMLRAGQYSQHAINEALAKGSITDANMAIGFTDWTILQAIQDVTSSYFIVGEPQDDDSFLWELRLANGTDEGELVASQAGDPDATSLTFIAHDGGIVTPYTATRIKIVTQEDLDKKADRIHTHEIEDVNGLPPFLVFKRGEALSSAAQQQEWVNPICEGPVKNEAISTGAIAEGGSSVAGLHAYRYVNTGSVTNSLEFEVEPEGWEVGDVVSVINDPKYPDCVTIASISGTTVTFTENLPFDSIVEESQWDSKCAYVSAKPDKGNVDLGYGAHAEGVGTKALNATAHAEGREAKAFGQYSHAEGRNTTAQYCAHAEGNGSKALGQSSHAEGIKTEAKNNYEHAEGCLNASHTGPLEKDKTRHSIGIGPDAEHRKNAVEVMVSGDAYLLNVGGYDGTNPGSSSSVQTVIKGVTDWFAGGSLAAGTDSSTGYRGVALGYRASTGENNTGNTGAVAIGNQAKALAEGACQIGWSSSANTVANTLRFHNTVIVDGNGKIPSANLDREFSQVNADWNATGGVAQILNKPTIPTTAADIGALAAAPLAGKTYDCSTNAGYYRAIEDIVRALGGTITNSQLPPAN